MGLGKFVKNVGLPVGLALATGQPWLAAPAVTNLLGQKEADDEKKRREKQAKRDAALRAFGGVGGGGAMNFAERLSGGLR